MNMLGTAAAVEGHPELSKLYILLGRPLIENHQRAYAKAKDILHKIKIDKQLVEEDEAEDFAKHLRDYMKAHGLMEE